MESSNGEFESCESSVCTLTREIIRENKKPEDLRIGGIEG